MSKEKRLTPDLRFPEFDGEWKISDVTSVSTLVTKGTTPRKKDNIPEVKLVKVESIKNGKIDLNKCENISYKVHNSELLRSKLHTNDILFSIAGTLGRVALVDERDLPLNVNQALAIIRAKKDVDIEYLKNVLNSTRMKKYIKLSTSVGAQPNLSLKQVGEFAFGIPEITEQRKIATFLSLIDKKIELLEKKVELLEQQKMGLLQKLFSQEIRFKKVDGSEFEKWKEVSLRKILREVHTRSTINNQFDVISSTNSGLYLQKEYFSRNIASENNIGYKVLRMNQIVLSPQNLWMGNINYNDKYVVGIVSPSYKIFEIQESNDQNFVSFLLRTKRAFYNYRLSSEQGASIVRRNLNLDLFLDIKFKIPTLIEQKKIAVLLVKHVKIIDLTKDKLQYMETLKKNLLQKLFV